jgi:hypothetical protein
MLTGPVSSFSLSKSRNYRPWNFQSHTLPAEKLATPPKVIKWNVFKKRHTDYYKQPYLQQRFDPAAIKIPG